MTELATANSSAIDAVIPWRMRRDLVARAMSTGSEAGWTLKDPLSLAYFRLRDAEFAVWSLLDGRITYASLLSALRDRFPAEQWSLKNLQAFLSQLAQSGLVTALIPGQGRLAARQQAALRWKRRLSAFTSVLAIRWRGLDPEPWLKKWDGWTRWLFHPALIGCCLALIVFSAGLVTLRWDTLVRRLPAAHSLFGWDNLLPLMLAFIVIKLLHELGHVLTCRHFGGECHELGVLWLVFVPVFYGDVTDAWMLPRRGPRIAISLAGIFVELVLAALCTLLWWHSVPGVLNSMFLNVMLVCSVSTFLVNGNPLLRYDGYYALADAAQLPNLSQQASEAASSWLERLLVGAMGDEADDNPTRRWLLVSYGIASAAYRWVVLLTIVWYLHGVFSDMGLGIVVTLLSVPMLGAAVVFPTVRFARRIRSRWQSGTVPPRRLISGLVIGLAILLAVLLVPFPHSVSAPFVVYPGDAQPIFAGVAGRIETAIAAGTLVTPGQTVCSLSNEKLRLRHERQSAEVALLALRLKNLEAQRGTNQDVSPRLPAARDALASAQRRLEQLEFERQRLVLVSPTNGTVLPPPNLPPSSPSDETLSDWFGTPLDAVNRGATVREQTLLCYVGNAARQDALLVVDQASLEFVRVGQTARVQFRSWPGQVRTGEVAEIATRRSELLPRELVVTQGIAAQPSDSGPAPVEVSYEVRVRLADSAVAAPLYLPGQARIDCGRLCLAARLWRLLRHTFTANL